MPYSINKYDGTTVTVVEDGTINNTLDLKLVGKDYPGYGEIQNENFVFMLENFAGTSQPQRPLNGQLWYDTSARKIKVYDKLGQKWRSTGSAEVDVTPPVGLGIGDLWWDSKELKLYVNSQSGYVHIGPQSVYDHGITQMRSRGIADQFGSTRAVIEAYSNGNIENIISSEAFDLHPTLITQYGNRFTKIRKGLNLAYTNDDGVSTVSDTRYWGTASDSDRLGGLLPSAYVLAGAAHFPDAGFTVGDHQDLRVFIQNGETPIIQNQLASDIRFFVKYNSQTICPILIDGNKLLPGISLESDIGSSVSKFNTVYAASFNGVATNADTIKVGTSYVPAALGVSANTIAARDSNADISARLFKGTATSAQYADLAEKYIPDADYDIGTVMVVGGVQEITQSVTGDRAIGVISAKPAFMMNSELENGVYVALKGRVPVKVAGIIKKGDRLIAGDNGVAISTSSSTDVFAIALENNDSLGVTLIEAIIL